VLFHGVPASPGIAIGPIRFIGGSQKVRKAVARKLAQEEVESEICLFEKAAAQTADDIRDLQERLRENSPDGDKEAAIFDAQLLIVSDKMLSTEVAGLIRKQLLPADEAFNQMIQRYITAISSMPDTYLRERSHDIQDVANRVMNHLSGMAPGVGKSELKEPVVIIARDLTPSDTASLDRSNVLGFAIETGSKTSHTAILARSMKIPAVVGMQRIVERLHDGDQVIIDGYIGMVIIHPDPDTIDFYKEKMARNQRLYEELQKENQLRAETTDGFRVQLVANVEGTGDLDNVRQSGAEGIGLFRTEYLFMNKPVFPDEETQFQVYKTIAESMKGQPVIIRTLDVGGDKLDAILNAQREPNPFLGMRAIRLCLDRPELMRTQLRAILRAGVYGDIRILFPMISSMKELDQLLDMMEEVKNDMMSRQMSFKGHIEVGVMIEIPGAALIADQLAKKVDFFSIGSNDLVQYTLAVDRGNEKVSYLYNPMHPAVIDLICRAAKAAHDNGIWISCCGELAGDPIYTPLLVGLGIQELSMNPNSIAPVRRIIRRMSMFEAEALADEIMETKNPDMALELSRKMIAQIAPDILKMSKGS